MRYEMQGEVWVYPGKAAWHFITLPKDVSEGLRALAGGRMRPFGSVSVAATVGATTWRTSLFADRKAGAFLLPLKASVRRREGLNPGDVVALAVELEL